MDQFDTFGEGAAENLRRKHLPPLTLSVCYPSPQEGDWEIVKSKNQKALSLSREARLSCRHKEDLSSISIRRDAASGTSHVIHWPDVGEYVRFELDLSSLAQTTKHPYVLNVEVTLSLTPKRPVECHRVALGCQDELGRLRVHRVIESKIRFTPTDTSRGWQVRLTGEEIREAGRLVLFVQFAGAATEFRLDRLGARVQSLETNVAAFTACVGGLVEGWTRIKAGTLCFGASPENSSQACSSLEFGYFMRPVPKVRGSQESPPGLAYVLAEEDVLAFVDLSCLSPALSPEATAGSELSLQAVEWLHAQRKVELLWWLDAQAELPEAAKQVVSLYRSLHPKNAVESTYRGLRDAMAGGSALQAVSPKVQRLLRLGFVRACVRTGRIEEAKAMLQQMEAADPLDWAIYFELANISTEPGTSLRHRYFQVADSLAARLSSRALCLMIEDLLCQGKSEEAWARTLRELKARGPKELDLWLCLANTHLARGDRRNWGASVCRVFSECGLVEPELEMSRDPSEDVFHRLTVSPVVASAQQDHLITVIMTTFNAERTVKVAVQSVLAQSYRNLRLVIVDDCSTDDTMLLLRQLKANDQRVEILQTPSNVGTYCAKNMALARFESDFFTFHDSDDWMHPERLALHYAAMQADPRLMCNRSLWFRMDMRGVSSVRRSGEYLHINPASTFFPGSILKQIGFFDSVRNGADSELVERMEHCFGQVALQVLAKPLTIGLSHSASLTRSGVGAYDEHHYSGPRVAYVDSWVDWHRRSVLGGKKLYMPFPHFPRRFAAPDGLVPERLDELAKALAPEAVDAGHALS